MYLRFIFVWFFVGCAHLLFAQKKDVDKILAILNKQTEAWNKGNIDEYMMGYWQSDSLMFIGKNGVTRGWQNTLNNYKKSYATPEQMGKLNFTILKVEKINKNNYFVVGKWYLNRTVGDIGGHYSLWFKKINGNWVIVADHSS